MLLIFIVFGFIFDDTSTWPSFLGVGHSQIKPDSVPISWSPTEHIAWKMKLAGKGQSSPVVWGDTAFVTSIEGSMKEKCHVQAIAVSSGELLWTRTLSASQTIRSNYFQSRSAPTPLVDANQVVAFFETGNLAAINHAGEVLWEKSLTEEYGPFESTIGLAASPIQHDDRVIILVDHEGASYLLSVDKKTGETIGKGERDSRVSYASPSIAVIAGKPHIVCSSAGSIEGFDPANGERLWHYDQVGGNSQNTPLAFGDGFFLVGASPGMHDEREAIARESNLCMQIVKTDAGYEPKVIWKNSKALTTFASPIAYKGHAYWVTKAGVLYCFDLATGEEKYKQRIAQQCWATPFGIDDRIYFFGKDGTTAVIASGPEYKLIAENQLWDPSLAPPTNPGSRGGRSTHEHSESDGAKPTTSQRPQQVNATTESDSTKKPGPSSETASAANQTPDKESVEEDRRGGPPQTEAEREAARSQGENRFADPVQYGYAITNRGITIRTGEVVYCVR